MRAQAVGTQVLLLGMKVAKLVTCGGDGGGAPGQNAKKQPKAESCAKQVSAFQPFQIVLSWLRQKTLRQSSFPKDWS
jgi:hypothetical protein